MGGKKILMLAGEFTEEYEIFVFRQGMEAAGHTVHVVCPDKKAGDRIQTSVHDFEGHQTYIERFGHFAARSVPAPAKSSNAFSVSRTIGAPTRSAPSFAILGVLEPAFPLHHRPAVMETPHARARRAWSKETGTFRSSSQITQATHDLVLPKFGPQRQNLACGPEYRRASASYPKNSAPNGRSP